MKKKWFTIGFVTCLLVLTASLVIPNTVIVTAEGQYGYYDSGDGYSYNGWFEPATKSTLISGK